MLRNSRGIRSSLGGGARQGEGEGTGPGEKGLGVMKVLVV